ncbi:MAG: DnaD domain protein [Bacilli bacterium]
MKVTLLPADIYQVVNKAYLSESDKLVLSMLYMPIIGNNPISLYLSLYNELKQSNFMSCELNHRHLMTSMGLNLDTIKESRIKLEGIGLMKTYFLAGSVNSYIYELYCPVSAKEFFESPIFNVVLFNNVGKEEYNRLINSFKMPIISLKNYTDITKSFDYTYKSESYTNLELENINIMGKNKLKLSYEIDYDFDLLISSLPKSFNEKCLNKSLKELIINLSFLYELDPITIADIIKSCINIRGNIEKEELRKNVRKYYQFNNEGRLPSLLFKEQLEYLKSPMGNNSNRGKIIKVFENNSPYEFLKSKNKGIRPAPSDMKLLEYLIVELKLSPAVVNVLVDYVLRINNNKLTRSYCEKIASQWKRSGIETAAEAMEIAEKEHNKIKKISSSFSKKEEKAPAWFNKTIEKEELTSNEKSELESLLKEFK